MRITLVDDSQKAIEIFTPLLAKEIGGRMESICHRDEGLSELVEKILHRRSDLLLLDYNLAHGIKGAAVAQALLGRGLPGWIIGFSTVPAAAEFKAVGVSDFVTKDLYRPETSIAKLKFLYDTSSANAKAL